MFTKYFASAALVAVCAAAPEADRVMSLPDMADFDTFPVYSGYLDIPDTTKMLHYMFVESQNDPASDPLLVWFNGGPGCSSMLGWSQEHGPYVMESGETTFHKNEWSWNTAANVIYIESPAGVGFSYCGTPEDCTFNDDTSAQDNLTAVLQWFEKFPEFKEHDLYISGESYAGIYVPYLSWEIDQHNVANADDDSVFKPNLKGFAVGNGVTNLDYDNNGAYVEMGYWHSLYSDDLHDKFVSEECDFAGLGMPNASLKCKALLVDFDILTRNVNIYNIYGICWGTSENPAVYGGRKGVTAAQYTPWLFTEEQLADSSGLPPCTFGEPIMEYFDRDDVREALHVSDKIGEWELCTSNIQYTRGAKGSQWVYEELHGKYRMLHFSGDVDGAVSTVGTQGWIDSLNWEAVDSWRPYMYGGQVAGYVTEYVDDFTFATVHGSGHMVPQDKRPEAHYMIYSWLNNTAM